MKKIWFLFIGIAIVLAAVVLFSRGSEASGFESINSMNEINIYKSLTCGCCDVYSSYVDGKVSTQVNIFDIQDSSRIKEQYNIPSELRSCHTSTVGDYFVEGHIPLEAVEKLLKEQPNISGIAMPGMPEGSPGMPGSKRRDFVVYAVNNDGTYYEFIRI